MDHLQSVRTQEQAVQVHEGQRSPAPRVRWQALKWGILGLHTV